MYKRLPIDTLYIATICHTQLPGVRTNDFCRRILKSLALRLVDDQGKIHFEWKLEAFEVGMIIILGIRTVSPLTNSVRTMS